MGRKGHITFHDIELYLEGRIKKRKLEGLKDKFKKELKNEKKELERYREDFDQYVYEDEFVMYLERNEKNIIVLDALKKIFLDDKELNEIEI